MFYYLIISEYLISLSNVDLTLNLVIILTSYQLSSKTYPSTFELSLSEDAFTAMRFLDVVATKIEIIMAPKMLYLKTLWFACLTLDLLFDAIIGRL